MCCCRHSKSSAWVRSMYLVWRLLCGAVGTASHEQSQKHVPCVEMVLCAAIGTASHQHELEAGTMCGRPVTVLANDKAVSNLSALN